MKQKVFNVCAGVLVAGCVVIAGRALVQNSYMAEDLKEAKEAIATLEQNKEPEGDSNTNEKEISELQTQVKGQKTLLEEQAEIVRGLQADNAALLKLLASSFGVEEDELENMTLAELLEMMGETGYYVDVHEIYDDTEVVNAYLTGDDSKITDEKDRFVLDKVKEVIDENITENMTEYEKELAIYNWLVRYVQYDDGNISAIPGGDEYSHTPYGVMKYHNAICVGNVTTFKLFMDCLGIDCMIIHSTEEGEHAWNLVKIEGDWYHVDATFDSIADDEPLYQSFNVTDDVKEEYGYPWDHDEFPAATATKYCYAVQNAVEAEDIYQVPKILAEKFKEGGQGVLYLEYDWEDMLALDFIIRTIEQNTEYGYVNISGVIDTGDKVVAIIEYYMEGDYSEPGNIGDGEYDFDMDKLNEAMKDAFGYGLDMDDWS